MTSTAIDEETIRQAADAVTEFATVAFQAEFLRWDLEVNLAVAGLVWNHLTLTRDEPDLELPTVPPPMRPLRDRLAEVRRARWPEADWMVMAWQARVEGEHVVFAFDLWWDAQRFCQPCEMTWIPRTAEAADLN